MSNKSFGVQSHSGDSNELGTARSFQRTVSAQVCLKKKKMRKYQYFIMK